ncbi:MAG: phosphoribosyl-ATP diphosphatase [Gammaproteobacteria bacterium]
MTDASVLQQLDAVLRERLQGDPEQSYVAKLQHKGLDAILKKIGEEATETVIAAKSGSREQIIYETADLWFHCLVLLAREGIASDEILNELARRFGVSGLAEKASRDA